MRIDVGPLDLAVDVMRPEALSEQTKLFVCLPGGGVSRRYFDMGEPGDPRFSYARAMVALGHAVALIDPPGIGESGTIADPFELTVTAQMPMLERAVREIRKLPGLAPLPAIGVGHSAGAMLTAALQAHCRCYDALVLLCFGGGGLPQMLNTDWLELHGADPAAARLRIPEFAEAKFRTATFDVRKRDAESDATRALQATLTPTLATIALQSMTPGNVTPELATIDVPLFTAVGERDMVGPPHLLSKAYPDCTDFTQVVIAGAGHHIFLSENALALFARLGGWLRNVLEPSQ